MGGSQSYLYIYLQRREGKYGERGYTVNAKKKLYDTCINFEEITHEIDYGSSSPTKFDIYLHNGLREHFNDNYVFAYCSPSSNQIIKTIKVYFSTFIPEFPLIVSFITQTEKTYNCLYTTLLANGWDYASKIQSYSFSQELKTELPNQYKERSRNRKVTFKDKGKNNIKIKVEYYDIKNENKYKIYKYIPDFIKQQPFELFNEKLFDLNPKDNKQVNKLDSSYLSDVLYHHFNGISVYYSISDNVALLVEFVDDCVTKQYVRKDKNGYWWTKESVTYNDENSLEKQLIKIHNDSKNNDKLIFLIYKKSSYNDILVNEEIKNNKTENDTKNQPNSSNQSTQTTQKQSATITYNGHKKYTHKGKEEELKKKNTVILLNNQEVKFEGKIFNKPLLSLDVYFLREQEKKEDDTPFLLELTEEKSQKTYYTKKKDEDENWTKIIKTDNITDKFKKIDEIVKCGIYFNILREMAYKILLADDVKEIDKIKPILPKQFPDIEYKKYGLTIGDICGIVIGSLILAGIASVAGYGIYWYNTTIMLLT